MQIIEDDFEILKSEDLIYLDLMIEQGVCLFINLGD
jgi:hypothetical protein